MNEATNPAPSVAATLEQLDVLVWADKSIRECYAIAARTAKRGPRALVDTARTDAVLGLLIRTLEAKRRALTLPTESGSG